MNLSKLTYLLPKYQKSRNVSRDVATYLGLAEYLNVARKQRGTWTSDCACWTVSISWKCHWRVHRIFHWYATHMPHVLTYSLRPPTPGCM